MIVIIDYGAGNLSSIKNMLNKIGCLNVEITNDPAKIKSAAKLILPGVGHFDYGMQQLNASGLVAILQQCVIENKTPILGICLGAQLLTKGSEEGNLPGLGWIDAETEKFNSSLLPANYKIPHMGWGEVAVKKQSVLCENLPPEPRFYFVHSYHIVCHHEDDVLMTTQYGYEFTAAVEKENIMGVQFHPEKSHKYGMALLHNFATKI